MRTFLRLGALLRRLSKVRRLGLRFSALVLAVWMGAVPSVALASATTGTLSDKQREARRLAAVAKMRAETGADPAQRAALKVRAQYIDERHLPARLGGLSRATTELRAAVDQLTDAASTLSPEERDDALHRIQAQSAVIRAGAVKLGQIQKGSRHLGGLSKAVSLAQKVSQQLGPAIKGTPAVQTAALASLHKQLAKLPAPRAHPAPAAVPSQRLTSVTPRQVQASLEDTRRMHPLLASTDSTFRVATTLSELDEGALAPPVAADLLATPEAPITPAITALATKLGGPLAIYEYVRNEIQPEPYFGSKKGAVGTMLEGSGNDADQASLLVALLRASGVYTRYETGQVLLSPRQAMDFTNTDDPMAAVEVMDTIGMPATANLSAAGTVDSVTLDQHVWVRANVPYTNYRGINAPGSRNIWIRLDPSIKMVDRTPPAFAIGQNVTFNFNGYLSGTTTGSTTLSPLQVYEAQLTAYVQANQLSCDSLDKLLPQNPVVPLALRLLPSELGTQLLASESVGDALDPSTDYTFDIQVDNGISIVESLPATYGQPYGLRYVGATKADVAAITAAGTVLGISPNAVTLQPSLTVNGVDVWQGANIAPGTPQTLTVTVNVPGLPQAVATHNITAGGIYAIGLAAGEPTDAQLAAAKAQITTLIAGGATKDDTDEARAQALALTYLHHIARDERRIFGYAQDVGVKDVTESLAAHTVVGSDFLGVPVGVTVGPWRIDVGREANTPMPQIYSGGSGGSFASSPPDAQLAAVNELAGFQGSHWENRLFDEVFNSAGVSTTNGLQLAVAGGGQLFTLTVPGTTSQLTGYSSASTSEIEAALSAGQVATVPKAPFTSGNFQNIEAYVLLDPVAGTGVFREGSTFNGGEGGDPGTPGGAGGGCPFCSGGNQQTASFVNLSNGNYVFTRTDLTLPAVGIPIAFTRSYDSGSGVAGVLGNNWWHSYERKLIANANGTVTYVTGEGQLIQSLVFTVNGAAFVSPPGWNLTLVQNVGLDYTLTYKDGRSSSYDKNGRLTSDQDLNGNKITINRNADNTIKTVVDASGRTALTFAYTTGSLTSVTDAASRVVTFAQTGTDLTSAKDVLLMTEKYAYDTSHHLVGRTDKNGNLWSVAYDANGRWDQEVDPAGYAMAASYDNAGLSTAFTDRRGESHLTTYNSSGNPVAVTDPSGNTHTMTWDANLNKKTEVDGRGNTTSYTYDTQGNLTQKTAPDNGYDYYTYDTLGHVTLAGNQQGTVASYSYDAKENMLTSTDSWSNQTTYTHFATGQLKTVTAPGNTNATTFAYNADGTTQQITDPNSAITKFAYDAAGAGHLTSLTDPGNHTRSMTVDAAGHLLTMTDAALNKTVFTYDSEGNRKTLKDPSLAVTTFGYDALNRLSTTTDANSNVTSTTYDPEGAVTARTDANGKSTSYTYDESGRLIATTDALGNQSAMGFCADIGGSPCQEVDANGNVTQRAFDVVGRTTAVSDGLGNTTTSKYDLVGHLTSVTDARGNATTYSYYHGVLNGVTTPAGATSYYFDARMNRKQVNGPVSTTYFTFDANNRVLTEENALSKTWTYTYNPDGTRATKLDPNGNTTKYGYDANKRLTSVTFADTSTYTFAYDSRGHRTTEQDADLNRTLTYDTLGRLATVLDGTLNKTLTYGYDAVGNRTSLTYDGLTLGYTWDANHRLTQIVDPDGEATNFTYDPGGRRTSMVQGNGVVTSYTYDDANRVTAIASPVQSFNYTYDVVGNPTSKTFADGTSEKYAYDTANRLTNVTTRAKGTAVYGQLDGEGNRGAYLYNDAASDVAQQISDSYGINTFDQVLTDSHGLGSFLSKNTYVYDGNGNRTTLTYQDTTTQPPPAAQVTTYTWNEDDRLTKITFPSAATNTYTYDANGIRTTKKDSVANLRYLLDGASIIATYDAVAKTRLTTFTQNPARIDEIVSTKTSGGSKYYPHGDMLGSVHAVSDSTGTTQATWTFDPYGARTQASGTLAYTFGFTGREHDVDSGLTYSRQRYYDAALGTWLQPDRKGMRYGPNRYLYGDGVPTSFTDPTGNWADGPPMNAPPPPGWALGGLLGLVIGEVTAAFFLEGLAASAALIDVSTVAAAAGAGAQQAVNLCQSQYSAVATLSDTDARVMAYAMNIAEESGSQTFVSAFTAISQVMQWYGYQAFKLGTLGGNDVIGSMGSGVGIVDLDGVVMIVRMEEQQLQQVLGPFFQ